MCGKTTIESIRIRVVGRDTNNLAFVDAAVIQRLPGSLRDAQPIFDRTGGLHASALFDFDGNLQALREDVGRHNALDKLIGSEFLAGRTPLADRVLLVSGRASFELVQKAAVGWHSDPGGRRRPVEPGGRIGGRVRHDAARVRQTGSIQRVCGSGARFARSAARPKCRSEMEMAMFRFPTLRLDQQPFSPQTAAKHSRLARRDGH